MARRAVLETQFRRDDLLELAGPNAYHRGDRLHQRGHVLTVETTDDGLKGLVRGTWVRVDEVEVSRPGARFQATCTCGAPSPCQHAVALLLEWSREPHRFQYRGADTRTTQVTAVTPGGLTDWPDIDGAEEELTKLLGYLTVPDLRALAARRDVKLRGLRRDDLIPQAARGLADPASVDRALAQLDADLRLYLQVAGWLPRQQAASIRALTAVVEAAAGRDVPHSPNPLFERGLLFYQYLGGGYTAGVGVPAAVVTRLPPAEDLLPAARPPTVIKFHPSGEPAEALIALAHALRNGGYQPLPDPAVAQPDRMYEPTWGSRPGSDVPVQFTVGPRAVRVVGIGIMPHSSLLRPADRPRLAQASGLAEDAIDFWVTLFPGLGLTDSASVLYPSEDGLVRLLELPPDRLVRALTRAWAKSSKLSDLLPLIGLGGPIQVWVQAHAPWSALPLITRDILTLRQLVLRLIAGLPTNVWFEEAAFVGLIVRLAVNEKTGLRVPSHNASLPTDLYWFTESRQPDRPLNLAQPEHWRAVFGRIIGLWLAGPLSWFGLVESAGDRFRIRPVAPALLGRPVAIPAGEAGPVITIDDDLRVTVRSRGPGQAAHGYLGQIAAIETVGPAGLRYRIDPEKVRQVFQQGVTDRDIVAELARLAGGAVPPAVARQFGEWMARFGRVAIYEEVCLLELNDDIRLEELQATVSLDGAILEVLSPRLIVIRAGAVDDLAAELQRRGYLPRVLESQA